MLAVAARRTSSCWSANPQGSSAQPLSTRRSSSDLRDADECPVQLARRPAGGPTTEALISLRRGPGYVAPGTMSLSTFAIGDKEWGRDVGSRAQ